MPLEHLDKRYTTHLDRDIENFLKKHKVDYVKIYPQIEETEIKHGSFLDAAKTTEFKSKQLAILSKYYQTGQISDFDVIFFSDLWFPGIEAIPYMNYFCRVHPKIKGILHAGSFTDTDFVRDMERWAKNFEDVVFDITNEIFVGSNFIKDDVCKKRLVDKNKIIVTGMPLDYDELNKYRNARKENIVIFNGRNVGEKQPHVFEELKIRLRDSKIEFINTQKEKLSKPDYYALLAKAKCVVSFALQENFGFGILEAVYLGCSPVLPNRLVYPEQFGKKHLYYNFDDCVNKVLEAVYAYDTIDLHKDFNSKILFPTKEPFFPKRWFNDFI